MKQKLGRAFMWAATAAILMGMATCRSCSSCRNTVSDVNFDPTGLWESEDPAIDGGRPMFFRALRTASAGQSLVGLPACATDSSGRPTAGQPACMHIPFLRPPFAIHYQRADDLQGDTTIVESPAGAAVTLPDGYSAIGRALPRSCTRPSIRTAATPQCTGANPCADPASSGCLIPEPPGVVERCPDGSMPMGAGDTRVCAPRSIRRFGIANFHMAWGEQDPPLEGNCKVTIDGKITGYYYSSDALDLWYEIQLAFENCGTGSAVDRVLSAHRPRDPEIVGVLDLAQVRQPATTPDGATVWNTSALLVAKIPLRRSSGPPLPGWADAAVPRPCPGGSDWKFSHSPVDPASFPGMVPLGTLAGAHVFPTKHIYLSPWIRGVDAITAIRPHPLVAPTDLVIRSVSRWEHRYLSAEGVPADLGHSHWFAFTACQGIRGYFIYVLDDPSSDNRDLADALRILDAFGSTAAVPLNPVRGGTHYALRRSSAPALAVRAGTPLGVIGRPASMYAVNGGTAASIPSTGLPASMEGSAVMPLGQQETADLGLVDARPDGERPGPRTTAAGTRIDGALPAGVVRASAQSDLRGPDYRDAVCPWAYFPDAALDTLFAANANKVGFSFDDGQAHLPRGEYAKCGTALQELPGTLQGIWGRVGVPREESEGEKHLALVRDPIDTNQSTIAYGDAFNEALGRCSGTSYLDGCGGAFKIGASSGRPARTNVPFASVAVSPEGSPVYCYDGLMDHPLSTTALPYRFLVQVAPSAGTGSPVIRVKAERKDPGDSASCDRTAEWAADLVDASPVVSFQR